MSSDDKKNLIHICFVSLTAYPLFNPKVKKIHGGSEVDIYMLANELVKDNSFKISLVTGDYDQPDVEVIDGITLYKSTDLQKHPLAATLSIYKAMKKADAGIYFRKGASLITVLAALFCRLESRIFLFRSSNTGDCDGIYVRRHRFRGRLFKWSLKQAGVVFVQNQTDADSMKKAMGIESVFIANGHHLGVVNEKERDSILWVGRTGEFKRPELFVQLAKELPDEKFVMICPRNRVGESYGNLKLNEADNIEFHEQVPFLEIDEYFQRAKVFVNTSDSEGFPNTFIQACKCSTPILSLDVNPDDFLNKYNCGIYCNGDWKKFVKSLKSMLADNRYIGLGQNGRKYAEKNHDIIKIAEQYKKLFFEAKEKYGA